MTKPDPAERAAYPNAPVRLVVLSVEYPAAGTTQTHLDQLREALRGQFPLVDQQTEARVTFDLGSTAPARQQVVAIPSFSTRDRRTSVAVPPNQVVIETRRYDGFDWYVDLIRSPLEAVGQVLGPDAVTAIGHRFIDEVHLPADADGDLARWFDPALLAMANLPGIRPDHWQAVVNYQLDPESQLTLRFGPLDLSLVPTLDGRPVTFTEPVVGLDWDSRWAPAIAPEFDVDTIVDRLGTMYAPVRSLFRSICTDELRQRFATPPNEGKQ